MLVLRKAVLEDLKDIREIYNHAITNLTATFDEEEKTLEDRKEWFETHQTPNFPLLVVEDRGEILAWGCISAFRTRTAYRLTGETSIYVREDAHGRGLGSKIMEELMQLSKQGDLHTLIAVIADNNEPSIKLHNKFGFEIVGRLREVGYKFNDWVDVVFMQKMLRKS